MASAPVNPDVPSSVWSPDTYVYISTAPIVSDTELPKNYLILAPYINSGAALTSSPYSLTAGTAVPNTIEQYTNLNLVNTRFGRRSMAAQIFRAATQEVPIGMNIFIGAVQEPVNSGFAGVATALLMYSGTAVGSGEIKHLATGHAFRAPVASGDVASSIVVDAKTAMDEQTQDAQLVAASVIDISLPQITIATNATGSNFVITADGVAKTIAITAAWTPTQSATAIAAALVGDSSFPLTGTSLAGVLSLTWRTGFPPGTLTISAADATQTYTLAYLTTGSASGAILPVTYVHRGETGNDKGVIIDIPPEIVGVSVSPGFITVIGNALGSVYQLRCGSSVVPCAIAAADTPAQAAVKIAAAINAATFPLSATAVGAIVVLYYRSGWVVQRLQMASTEAGGGQTYKLFDRHDSAGALSSVSTVAGTATFTGLQGAGVPTLTTLLANRAKMQPFQEWVNNFVDATSLTAIFEHVTHYGDGFYQANQRFTQADSRGVEQVKDIVTSTTPQLSVAPGGWRPTVMVCQDCPMPAVLIAAQAAARLCADDLPYNKDGMKLAQNGTSPMLPPRAEVDIDPTTRDTAMRSYHLTVVVGNSGQVQIVRGVTTWGQTNTEWCDWSYGRMFDQYRYGLRAFLNERFDGKVLFVGTSEIRVDNAFTLADVRQACNEYNERLDGRIVDGAKTLAQTIVVERDPDDLTRIRIGLRLRVPREIHVKTAVVSGTA